jgi:hypothetical protein
MACSAITIARSDTTVVLDDRDAWLQAAEAGTSPTLIAVVGLPQEATRSLPDATADALPRWAAWSWQTHDPEAEERPPRPA